MELDEVMCSALKTAFEETESFWREAFVKIQVRVENGIVTVYATKDCVSRCDYKRVLKLVHSHFEHRLGLSIVKPLISEYSKSIIKVEYA